MPRPRFDVLGYSRVAFVKEQPSQLLKFTVVPKKSMPWIVTPSEPSTLMAKGCTLTRRSRSLASWPDGVL